MLHFIFHHDILITVADAETQKTTKKKLKNLVDIEKRRCYHKEVANERPSSSLKTERNKQRETSIFILDARQTNFIGEFDPGSG